MLADKLYKKAKGLASPLHQEKGSKQVREERVKDNLYLIKKNTARIQLIDINTIVFTKSH